MQGATHFIECWYVEGIGCFQSEIHPMNKLGISLWATKETGATTYAIIYIQQKKP